jgi:hypothetical protein
VFWVWVGDLINRLLDLASGGLRLIFYALGAGLGALILGRTLGLSASEAWDWVSSL